MSESVPRGRPGAVIALGLWIGIALGLARAGVALGMDHVAHGLELDASLWRVSGTLTRTLLAAGAAGLAIAGLTASARGRGVRIAAALLSAAVVLGVLSGVGLDAPSRVPGTKTTRGIVAWAGLAGLSLAAAFAAGALVRRTAARAAERARPLAPLVPLAAGLALALVPPALASPPPMRVREVRHAVLEERDWTVISENESRPVQIGAITPSTTWKTRGGERAALLASPGSTVSFRVPADVGPVRLLVSAGVDRNVEPPHRKVDEVRFRFTVEVDGRSAAEETIVAPSAKDRPDFEWTPLGGEDGIAVEPGSEVRLSTDAEAVPPDPRAREFPWKIGFSDLVLVAEREIPRLPSSPDNPNLVLVLMDTLRRDRLGCYGYERDTSPHLDALAERGVLYESAFSPSSWTWPSTASVLSGLMPETHGVRDDATCYLSRNVELLSEALQRAGYTTAGFSGNPLIVPSKNFDQGFEHFDGWGEGFRKSRSLVPQALEWMRAFSGQRFFLYLHLVDPHHPHEPREEDRELLAPPAPEGVDQLTFHEYRSALQKGAARADDGTWDASRVVPPEHLRYIDGMYDACVRTGDHWFGEVLAELEDLGLADETVVAFTSDHGEELLDRGMLAHGHTLHRELTGVPLVLAGPGIPRGVRSSVPVSMRHLGPTLARIGGARLRDPEDALDLSRPSELGPTEPLVLDTRYGWWNGWHRTPIFALRAGSWSLHWAPEAGAWGAEEPEPGGLFRLYDLDADPAETTDLADREPERARVLLEELQARLAAQAARRPDGAGLGAGEATREMLEGIGYIDGE